MIPVTAVGELPSRVVAYEGQEAPGGGGATYMLLYAPAIDREGNIAFSARLSGSEPNDGYWIDRDGDLRVYVREGELPPQTEFLNNTTWPSRPNIKFAAGDQSYIVFATSPPSGVGDTLWQHVLDDDLDITDGFLRDVARQGEIAPGTALPYEPLFGQVSDSFLANERGEAAFVAELDTPDAASARALFFFNGSSTRLVIREGDPAPGLSDGTLTSIFDVLLSQEGDIVFQATVKVGDEFLPSIWGSKAGTTPELLALQNIQEDPPDGTSSGAASLASINSVGTVLAQDGIYGTLLFPPLYREGLTILPDQVGVVRGDRDGLKSIGNPILLDDESIVFTATERNPPLRRGLFLADGTSILPLALEGDPAPGTTDVDFVSFSAVATNRLGLIAFEARLSDGTDGLFVTSQVGVTELLAKEGSVLSLPTENVTITNVVLNAIGGRRSNGADGLPANISNNNEVLWVAATTGGVVINVTAVGELPEAPPRLVGLEVIQVIQDWNNSVPLVEGKRTFVRAHVKRKESAQLAPRLRARRNGGAFEVLHAEPQNPGGRVSASSVPPRFSDNGAALYELPPSWTNGTVELEIDLAEEELVCREAAPPEEEDCRATVTFEDVATPRIRFITPAAGQISNQDAYDLSQRLLSVLPVQYVAWINQVKAGFPVRSLREAEREERSLAFGRALQYLNTLKAADGCSMDAGCNDLYYGAFQFFSDPEPGLLGIAEDIPGTVATGFVYKDPQSSYRHVHSHELGHLLGLRHATRLDLDGDGVPDLNNEGFKQGYCGELDYSTAADFPYFDRVNGETTPTLGPLRTGQDNQIWGYDSVQGQVVSPYEYFPLMSYCAQPIIGSWPSVSNFANLVTALNQRFASRRAPEDQGVADDYRLFRGLINFDAETVEPSPSLILPNVPLPDNPPTGSFALRLKDNAGAVLSEVFFDVQPDEDEGVPMTFGSYVIAVPDDPAIRSVEVLLEDKVKSVTAASANAPIVDVTFPDGGESLTSNEVTLTWMASDLDDDDLSYLVQYSPDNGVSWTTLAVDLLESELTMPRASLDGSDMGLIRVIASDGFNVSSDISASTFSTPNNDPEVYVDEPSSGSLFTGLQILSLRATAYDPEQGELDSAQIAWTSNIDGTLGNGSPLDVGADSLAEGEHTISAVVSDEEGAEAMASVNITVRRTAPSQLADLALGWEPEEESYFAGRLATVPLRVTNAGPEAAINVTVDFAAVQKGLRAARKGSPSLQLQGPPDWTCNATTCLIDSLPADSEAELSVALSESAPARIELMAAAGSSVLDPRPASDAVGIILDFAMLPDLLFADSFGD